LFPAVHIYTYPFEGYDMHLRCTVLKYDNFTEILLPLLLSCKSMLNLGIFCAACRFTINNVNMNHSELAAALLLSVQPDYN